MSYKRNKTRYKNKRGMLRLWGLNKCKGGPSIVPIPIRSINEFKEHFGEPDVSAWERVIKQQLESYRMENLPSVEVMRDEEDSDKINCSTTFKPIVHEVVIDLKGLGEENSNE
jgi:hypothetical protein